MTRYAPLLAAVAAAFMIAPGAAAEPTVAARPQQFLYMLRVAPHLHD